MKTVADDVTDLKARSMRGNLLFFGFPEKETVEDRTSEDCAQTVLDYCENTLKIPNARDNIKVERAHRLYPKYEREKN